MQLGSQATIGHPAAAHGAEPFDVVPGVRDGPVQQAVGDQRPAAAAQVRRARARPRSRPDGAARRPPRRRPARSSWRTCRGTGGPSSHERRRAPRPGGPAYRRASGLPANAGGSRRRSMPSSFSFSQRTGAAPRQPVRHRRQPAAPAAQPGDVAEHPVAPGQAVLAVVLVQELRLEPGHVHVGGALGSCTPCTPGTGRAPRAAPGRSARARPAWPVSASRRALARPRVLCCSSRVAW